MKEKIYEFIKSKPGTTFVELETLEGFKGDGKNESTMRLSENIILWYGINPEASKALNELIKEGLVVARGTQPFIYYLDGDSGCLDLPIAKTLKPKKRPYWYPVSFTTSDWKAPRRHS